MARQTGGEAVESVRTACSVEYSCAKMYDFGVKAQL